MHVESKESENQDGSFEAEDWEEISNISDVDEQRIGVIVDQGSESTRLRKFEMDAKEFMERIKKEIPQ